MTGQDITQAGPERLGRQCSRRRGHQERRGRVRDVAPTTISERCQNRNTLPAATCVLVIDGGPGITATQQTARADPSGAPLAASANRAARAPNSLSARGYPRLL